MREIKFRAWDKIEQKMWTPIIDTDGTPCSKCQISGQLVRMDGELLDPVMQYTGLKDKNGVEIWEGDILRFADKWEWYRGSYAIDMMFAKGDKLKELQEAYENEPYEERAVSIPDDYEWLLGGEIQQYWEVIGNIHQDTQAGYDDT